MFSICLSTARFLWNCAWPRSCQLCLLHWDVLFCLQDWWGVLGRCPEHVCSELVQGQGVKPGVWIAAQHGQNCECAPELSWAWGQELLLMLGLILGGVNWGCVPAGAGAVHQCWQPWDCSHGLFSGCKRRGKGVCSWCLSAGNSV